MCECPNHKGDEDMTVKEIKNKLVSKNDIKKIPHLNTVNGKVEIHSNDPKQVKWFEDFKK